MAATETSARANAVLDELYRVHVGDVYRYTYAVLGNHADAEDVTQTTFVNALRALERGETPEDPSRWLTVIAHNLVRQRWRQAAARPTLVELETDVPDAEEDEEAVELEELVRALQRIPETQREAIVMRELEGRSYREIATVMALSTSALETLLFRARRSLAEELENVVTCQNAELALSKSIDGRLSRKERRRLDEHLADCPDCARLAATQQRRRRAFKGLALLPLPIGLALFKGAPSAAAATLPTIGLGTAGAGTSGAGATGAAGAGATAATTTGGAAVGGSLAGGLVLKVAAIVVTATVAAGVGYKGVDAVRGAPAKTPQADVKKTTKTGAPTGAIAPRVRHAAGRQEGADRDVAARKARVEPRPREARRSVSAWPRNVAVREGAGAGAGAGQLGPRRCVRCRDGRDAGAAARQLTRTSESADLRCDTPRSAEGRKRNAGRGRAGDQAAGGWPRDPRRPLRPAVRRRLVGSPEQRAYHWQPVRRLAGRAGADRNDAPGGRSGRPDRRHVGHADANADAAVSGILAVDPARVDPADYLPAAHRSRRRRAARPRHRPSRATTALRTTAGTTARSSGTTRKTRTASIW